MSELENRTLAEIADVIRAGKNFVVVSHMRPDGDALGSTLAMTLALESLGHDVTAWNEDGILSKLAWLPGAELISRPPAEPRDFDVAIILDTATKVRTGTPLAAIRSARIWINIDHHISNERFGDLVHVNGRAPATGEIVFELLQTLQIPITTAIAENLFVAISTDTGSFQYPSTTARTYEIGAQLIRAGADVGRISQALYESYPLRRIELLRALLNELVLTCDGRVASVALSLETAHRLGTQPEDNEGLIDHIRAIDTVRLAVFFEELTDGRVRVSMRSKDVRYNVSTICGAFGGGGHALAAGARVCGSLDEVRQRVLEFISHEISRTP